MKIAILSDKKYQSKVVSRHLSKILTDMPEILNDVPVYQNYAELTESYDFLFSLDDRQEIPTNCCKEMNIIELHSRPLPLGRGWAPLYWKILADKKQCPISMVDATNKNILDYIFMEQSNLFYNPTADREAAINYAEGLSQSCLNFLNNFDSQQKNIKLNEKLDAVESRYQLKLVNDITFPAHLVLNGHRYHIRMCLDKRNNVSVDLIDFVDLSLDEKLMVHSWINNESVKEWMYTKENISEERHLDFIDGLELSASRQYLVIKLGNVYLGVVDFTEINFSKKTCYFGLYANPFHRFVSVGQILQEICSKYIFDILGFEKVNLEVFSDNSKAIKSYRSFGFTNTASKVVNGRKVSCMELLRNDRIFN